MRQSTDARSMPPSHVADAALTYNSLSAAAASAWAEGRVADALTRFALLRQHFPCRSESFSRAAALLLETGCAAEAAIVVAAGRARFPDDPALAAAEAEAASRQGRLLDALESWAALRVARPNATSGYLGAVATLLAHGAFDAADDMAAAATARLPDDPASWIAAAQVAAARPDPMEAAQRIATARARFPDDARLAALDSLTPALLDSAALVAAVGEAMTGARWELVADICRSVRARFPGQTLGYTAGAAAAMALGEGAAAAALLDEAERRHGPSPALTLARARQAEAAGDWAEAIAGFESARAALPDDPAPMLGLVRSLRAAGHVEAAEKALAFGLRQFPDAADLQAERDSPSPPPPRRTLPSCAGPRPPIRTRCPGCWTGSSAWERNAAMETWRGCAGSAGATAAARWTRRHCRWRRSRPCWGPASRARAWTPRCGRSCKRAAAASPTSSRPGAARMRGSIASDAPCADGGWCCSADPTRRTPPGW